MDNLKKIISEKEYKILKKLNTPVKIQDFLGKLKVNFESDGETANSPMTVLEKKLCHCLEAAVLAALALRVNGYSPLVIDLTAIDDEFDHVVAIFKKDGYWGAISKTNHAVDRYREPIYRSIRELAMSYFHQYIDEKGQKNLRSYSLPVNLKRFDKLSWMTTREPIKYIEKYLYKVKHFPMLNPKQIRNLRRADPIEIEACKLVE